MKEYRLLIPDDLTGYEINPGDFLDAISMVLDTWFGPNYRLTAARDEIPEGAAI